MGDSRGGAEASGRDGALGEWGSRVLWAPRAAALMAQDVISGLNCWIRSWSLTRSPPSGGTVNIGRVRHGPTAWASA